MANEPTVSPSNDSAAQPQRHIRTFAQDVARLSGKPMPPPAKAETKPAPPAKPIPPPPQPAPSAGLTKDIAAIVETEVEVPRAQAKPVQEPAPLPKPEVPAPRTDTYREPLPEPAPAYIIPKAPSTSETREAVLARLRARAVPQPEPAPEASAFVYPKAPSTNESREDVLARLRAKAAASQSVSSVKLPEQEPAAPPAVAPAIPTPTRITAPLSKIPEGPERIHTYKTDFAERAVKESASPISVLAAQADAAPIQTVVFKEKKPFPVALFGGLLLILIGSGALYGAYHVVTNRPMTVFVPRVPALIVPDEREELPGDDLYAELLAAVEKPLAEGQVRVIYTSVSTTTERGVVSSTPQSGGVLVQAVSLGMPDILLRSIKEESTVGAITENGNQGAFFILKVDSFERSFAGMLDWERTMASDLAQFYPEYAPFEEATTTASTTPSASTIAVSVTSAFKDELVGNRDVRALRDSEGRTILLYGFRDKETLIIARDGAAYLALVERLAASRGE